MKILKYVLLTITLLLIGGLIINLCVNYLFSPDEKVIVEEKLKTDQDIIETKKATRVVNFYGYNYEMAGNYYYKIDKEKGKDILTIYNNVDKCGGAIRMINTEDFPEGIYEDDSKLEEFLVSKGNKISNKKILEIDGKNIVTFHYDYNDTIGILGYIKAYDNYYYQLVVYDENNVTNYQSFEIIAHIAITGKKAN